MKKYGILAYPAKHSLSPALHNAGFKDIGWDGEYVLFEKKPEELAEFMEEVSRGREALLAYNGRSSDKSNYIAGLSVSLPHKETVMEYLDEIDEAAREIGAVNTVVRQDDSAVTNITGGMSDTSGKVVLKGYNTDWLGCVRALVEVTGSLDGKRIVVLGAGGSARAIVYGLLKNGAEVVILNRTAQKAEALAEEMKELFGLKIEAGDLTVSSSVTGAGLDGLANFVPGDILIQTTAIWLTRPGGASDFSAEEVEAFCPGEYLEQFDVIMDTVYKPLVTPLLARGRDLGCRIITGDKMLLYQAVEQFKLWTGQEAPVKVMEKALNKSC